MYRVLGGASTSPKSFCFQGGKRCCLRHPRLIHGSAAGLAASGDGPALPARRRAVLRTVLRGRPRHGAGRSGRDRKLSVLVRPRNIPFPPREQLDAFEAGDRHHPHGRRAAHDKPLLAAHRMRVAEVFSFPMSCISTAFSARWSPRPVWSFRSRIPSTTGRPTIRRAFAEIYESTWADGTWEGRSTDGQHRLPWRRSISAPTGLPRSASPARGNMGRVSRVRPFQPKRKRAPSAVALRLVGAGRNGAKCHVPMMRRWGALRRVGAGPAERARSY